MSIGWSATGKTQRNLALNAAPINVADYLRAAFFGTDTSVIMTSATLAVAVPPAPTASETRRPAQSAAAALLRPARSAGKSPL